METTKRCAENEKSIAKLDERTQNFTRRFDEINKKVDKMDKRFDGLDDKIDNQTVRIIEIVGNVTAEKVENKWKHRLSIGIAGMAGGGGVMGISKFFTWWLGR